MNKTEMIKFMNEMALNLDRRAEEAKEDLTFWANYYNSQRCREIALYLEGIDT